MDMVIIMIIKEVILNIKKKENICLSVYKKGAVLKSVSGPHKTVYIGYSIMSKTSFRNLSTFVFFRSFSLLSRDNEK